MQTARQRVHVPGAALQVLLGTGSVNPAAAGYRRTRVVRDWPCGCRATYVFDRCEDTEWEPCAAHSPAEEALCRVQ
jgi:hypothetical protein